MNNSFCVPNEDADIIRMANIGDVVKLSDGNNYRIDKKTWNNAAIRRYHWWNRLWDKYIRKP